MTQQRDEIPAELLEFLHSSVDSVEGLQVLLLLHEARTRHWTLDTLSAELRSSKVSVQKRVQSFLDRGVLLPESLAADGTLRFLPASADLERIVGKIADLYLLRPHRVIAQIFARPPDPLRSFAAAFRMNQEND